jgi:hypothetical protein
VRGFETESVVAGLPVSGSTTFWGCSVSSSLSGAESSEAGAVFPLPEVFGAPISATAVSSLEAGSFDSAVAGLFPESQPANIPIKTKRTAAEPRHMRFSKHRNRIFANFFLFQALFYNCLKVAATFGNAFTRLSAIFS